MVGLGYVPGDTYMHELIYVCGRSDILWRLEEVAGFKRPGVKHLNRPAYCVARDGVKSVAVV